MIAPLIPKLSAVFGVTRQNAGLVVPAYLMCPLSSPARNVEHLAIFGEPHLAERLNVIVLNMTVTEQAQYAAKARIMKALAHPTRLFIVDELSRGERCVCELTEMIGVEMPTVSRHLSQLKKVGILEDEKRGAQVFYRVRVPCVLNFFKCVEAVQSNGASK